VGHTGTPAPQQSASAPITAPATPVPPQTSFAGLAWAPSGALYVIARRCPSDCGATATTGSSLLRSSDFGTRWTTVGDLPGAGVLLAASDTQLWLVTDAGVSDSTDGGHSWRNWSVGAGTANGGLWAAGLAGGTAWIAQNGTVAVATGGGAPVATPTQPPGAGA